MSPVLKKLFQYFVRQNVAAVRLNTALCWATYFSQTVHRIGEVFFAYFSLGNSERAPTLPHPLFTRYDPTTVFLVSIPPTIRPI